MLDFIEKNSFPDHIYDVIREFQLAECQEKERIERERSLCKVCKHSCLLLTCIDLFCLF